MGASGLPEEKRHRGLKIFGITVGIILGVLAVVYLAGVFIFMGRFFPNSSIIDMDISGKTPEEVHQMLDGPGRGRRWMRGRSRAAVPWPPLPRACSRRGPLTGNLPGQRGFFFAESQCDRLRGTSLVAGG